MTRTDQIGAMLAMGLGLLAVAFNANAQQPHANPPPPPHTAQPHAPAPHHPPAHTNSLPAHAQNPNRPAVDPNRPPSNPNVTHGYRPGSALGTQNNFVNGNRPNQLGGANLTPRQQVGAGAARPWVDTMRSLTPQQRERVLQNSKAFQNLSPDKQNKIRQQFTQWDHMTPQQQENLRSNEQKWRQLTPEQQQHIKNDVLPKWKQMPWDRQQVIKQKLGVLQNMPESARNRRLSDPNFTRGMSDDEKSMLQDLSHTHVGGPPEE